MVTAKDPVPPAHSTSSASGANQAPPVSSAASAPPKGTKRASAAIRVPPAPVGPRSCCSTQFPSESALLAHLRTAHSVGGLVHLSQEKLVSFGLAQCDACLQVLMPGSASHPRNCVALEAGAVEKLHLASQQISLKRVAQSARVTTDRLLTHAAERRKRTLTSDQLTEGPTVLETFFERLIEFLNQQLKAV